VAVELERSECLRLLRERDRKHDGAFLVGVRTTGIYCLPSCRVKPAREENLRFFSDEPGARAAGLRPCKRCRPDHFYRGFDPERELAERLAEHARRTPGAFPDVASLARTAGVGATKLTELFRVHHHASPAAFLLRARVAAAARELAGTKRRVLDVALDAGFESSSAFHENFQRRTGTTPLEYRRLADSDEFELCLPDGFRAADPLSIFGRDPEGRTERVQGDRAAKALLLDGRPALLDLAFAPGRVRVRVESERGLTREARLDAHAAAARLLGLGQDPSPFERQAVRKGFARLVRGREGVRIPQTASLFEGVVWVIVGQQVNLSFASTCRARLIELCGTKAPRDFLAHPTPAAVARLEYPELEERQFSRNKARFLVDAAREIDQGKLDLEALGRASARRIEERLLEVRGLGPWSVRYLLMRAFGLEDCVPVGDAALTLALQRWFELAERPGPAETERLLEPFTPHRSLATFHFWKSLGDEAGDDT
jgi:AraC family transcriptional regulator of adaptative response / DNA-3-methyladenine glycosylase II